MFHKTVSDGSELVKEVTIAQYHESQTSALGPRANDGDGLLLETHDERRNAGCQWSLICNEFSRMTAHAFAITAA